jgi:hypothetical protein
MECSVLVQAGLGAIDISIDRTDKIAVAELDTIPEVFTLHPQLPGA